MKRECHEDIAPIAGRKLAIVQSVSAGACGVYRRRQRGRGTAWIATPQGYGRMADDVGAGAAACGGEHPTEYDAASGEPEEGGIWMPAAGQGGHALRMGLLRVFGLARHR